MSKKSWGQKIILCEDSFVYSKKLKYVMHRIIKYFALFPLSYYVAKTEYHILSIICVN